jgi:hypothetical protein
MSEERPAIILSGLMARVERTPVAMRVESWSESTFGGGEGVAVKMLVS